MFAVLGHNYSPWVGFKGGKGIATSAGVLLALMPFAVILLLAVWGLLFAITRYVSVASIGAAAILPSHPLGFMAPRADSRRHLEQALVRLHVAIAAMAVWKHRANIQRLREGTENRFERKKA